MNRPVRVLFVAGSLGGGGAERQLVELLKHLDRGRIEPRLYLDFRRGELLPEVPADVPISVFGEPPHHRSLTPRILGKLRLPYAARAAFLRELLTTHPVEAVMSWSLMCGYPTALSLIGRRCPHLTYAYCRPQSDLDELFPQGRPFRRRLARWTYRHATRVLANSDALRAALCDFYKLPQEQVVTLLNYRDFERIDRLAQETPAHSHPASVGPRIVAAGRLHADKGFDVLLQAVEKASPEFPNVELWLLGQGPEERALRECAGRLRLSDRVRFLGFQPNPYPCIQAADLFVLSSRSEGMPGVLIEALACGVPVVATDCPTGPREILEGGKFGRLIPVDDVDAMAEAIRAALRSPPSKEDLAAARRSVEARFGMATGIQRFEEIVQAALALEPSS